VYVEQLVHDGYVVLEDAIDADFCEDVVARTFSREGWDDPGTWPVGPVHLPATTAFPLSAVAPAAVEMLTHLVGGVGACRFSDVPDNLIVNFPDPSARPRPVAERAREPQGWHKDGDWFRHYLDSPEQGLLGIILWRDVTEDMGPTCVASDSVGRVARFLADHPGGIDPVDLMEPLHEILGECRDIRALTGRQGTIVFAHPFLLHAVSPNPSTTPRVISNTSVMLREPMRFDRNGRDLTDVESATLRLLGVDSLEFAPSGLRRRVESARERAWAERSMPESTADDPTR
jgi:hypothetical protein